MIKYAALALSIASTSVIASSEIGDLENIPDVESKAKQGLHGQVGIAIARMPEYIGGKDDENKILPLINVSYNDRFYFKFNRLGAWIYKSDNGFRVGGVISQHKGWESDDSDLLAGKSDRDDSTMAGINAAYAKGKFNSEIGYVTDISNESDGSKFYAAATYTMLATRNYTLSATAKVSVLDEDLTSYYYSDADTGYEADSATNISLGLIGTYNISKKWTAIAAVTANSLDDEISDSPLVEDDTHNMVLMGVTYSF